MEGDAGNVVGAAVACNGRNALRDRATAMGRRRSLGAERRDRIESRSAPGG